MDVVASVDVSDANRDVRHVAVAALDEVRALVCYANVAASYAGFCRVLTAGAASLSLGSEYTFASSHVNDLSVSAFDSATAVACGTSGSSYSRMYCRLLSVSASTVSSGANNLLVDSEKPRDMSVSAFSATHAVVCWKEDSHSYRFGRCCVLQQSGGSRPTDGAPGPRMLFDRSHFGLRLRLGLQNVLHDPQPVLRLGVLRNHVQHQRHDNAHPHVEQRTARRRLGP